MGLTKELFGLYRRSPTILVLHVCGALIAWFAPDDVLTRYPVLKAVTTSVGEIFPLLSKAVEKSHFPEVTELYFALMLAATPIRLWGGARLFYSDKEKLVSCFRSSIKNVMAVLLLVPTGIGIGVFFLFWHGLYFEINFMPISAHRYVLGLIGPLFAGGYQVGCLAAGLVWLFLIIQLLLRKGN